MFAGTIFVGSSEATQVREFDASDFEILREILGSISGRPSITASDIPVVDLLELLSPLFGPYVDEASINGVTTHRADTPTGEARFVPDEQSEGVEVVAWGSAGWVGGGPSSFEQEEQILRFGDFYWIRAWGDGVSGHVAVGRHKKASDGRKASISASTFFSFSRNGRIVKALRRWGNSE